MLKLAVSYRLVTNLGVDKEIADNEEFRLIKEIVMRIVKSTISLEKNFKCHITRKNWKMELSLFNVNNVK